MNRPVLPSPTAASDNADAVYLQSYLAPLAEWLDAPDVTEILVNAPGEIWVERAGGAAMERHDVPALDRTRLERLAGQIARTNHQGISRESPLLSAVLPSGARVQIVAPPATRAHHAVAIRKHVLTDLSLADFAPAMGALGGQAHHRAQEDQTLRNLAMAGDAVGLLSSAVAMKRTLLIAGGTSSGKTTLLNALLKEVPEHERVIVIEDTPEVKLSRVNAVGLVAVPGDQGEARVTIDDLMRAALRMRPDRLMVGELRGPEVVTFLRAINTGHPGSLATIHANSIDGALDQIALMCLQAGLGLGRDDALAYATAMIDVVVHLTRVDGRRVIEDVRIVGR